MTDAVPIKEQNRSQWQKNYKLTKKDSIGTIKTWILYSKSGQAKELGLIYAISESKSTDMCIHYLMQYNLIKPKRSNYILNELKVSNRIAAL